MGNARFIYNNLITAASMITASGQMDGFVSTASKDGSGSSGGDHKPKEPPKVNPEKTKKIADWGEKYVYFSLKKKYEKKFSVEETDWGFKAGNDNEDGYEIYWLNLNGNVGKGCDFLIKKNGSDEIYIEVKTKECEDQEYLMITGTQWELARKLHRQGQGTKYWIYVVNIE